MGVKKALDGSGFLERKALYSGGDVQSYWMGVYEAVNTALELSDQALAESGLDEFHSLGYQSKYDEIWNEFDKMNQLAKYVVDLEEDLYGEVDATFAKALIEPGSGAFSLLCNIKADDIQIKNSGLVEEQWCWSDYGDGYANTETGTYIPKTVGFDRFIGYNKECNAAETSYVVGFTDVLYAPMLLEGQTLEGYLRYHQKEYQELFYQTDYRIERSGLELLSNILDGVTFGGTALIRSSTGYNIVTKEVLTDADQAMAGIQGSILLCSSVFMFVTAGVSGASIVYVLVANGVEVVATETAQAICKELGLSPTATIAITALTGIMVAGGMSALLVQMNRAGAVQLGKGALEVAQSADGLVKPNQLDEIAEVGDDAAKALKGGSTSFYKAGGGSNLDDFMTVHAEKHVYNPAVISTKNKTQFGENIDVAKLRQDTMLNPDKVVHDLDQNVIKYEKEYDFNISTPDTPTGSHRVFINLEPKPGKMNRNSQFPYFKGDK